MRTRGDNTITNYLVATTQASEACRAISRPAINLSLHDEPALVAVILFMDFHTGGGCLTTEADSVLETAANMISRMKLPFY